MSGHGHVVPNADGSRTRCGGPGMCAVCNIEAAADWRRLRRENDALRAVIRQCHECMTGDNPPPWPVNAIDAALAQGEKRPCTCHPDDNPPRPCPQKFALTECRAAALAQGEKP